MNTTLRRRDSGEILSSSCEVVELRKKRPHPYTAPGNKSPPPQDITPTRFSPTTHPRVSRVSANRPAHKGLELVLQGRTPRYKIEVLTAFGRYSRSLTRTVRSTTLKPFHCSRSEGSFRIILLACSLNQIWRGKRREVCGFWVHRGF